MLHRSERRTLTTKQVRETEAEAVAFVVCQSLGLETGSASADYIQLWNGSAKLLQKSLKVVQRTAAPFSVKENLRAACGRLFCCGEAPRLCAASFRNSESRVLLNSSSNSRSSLQYTQFGSEQYGEPTRGSRLSALNIHHQREEQTDVDQLGGTYPV